MTRTRPPINGKRDANEKQIVGTLEAHGISVVRLPVPVDLLCGYGGFTWIAEVKTAKGKLTAPQIEFYSKWRGNKTVLRSVGDAEQFARECRNEKRVNE